jgi:hypothetical protein
MRLTLSNLAGPCQLQKANGLRGGRGVIVEAFCKTLLEKIAVYVNVHAMRQNQSSHTGAKKHTREPPQGPPT